MTPDGIEVYIKEPTADIIKASAKNRIVSKIVEAYLESDDGKNLIKSVKIDTKKVEVAVERALVQEIIKDWAARHGVNPYECAFQDTESGAYETKN